MAIKKPNWVEIGRIIAIIMDALAGAVDKLCDRAEKKAGGVITTPEAPEETELRNKLQEGYD